MIQRLLAEKSHLKPTTVRGIHATLRAALTKAWKEDLVESNVGQRATLPKIPRLARPSLTPVEAARLIEESQENPLRNLVALALTTGMRIGELLGLTWNDVDFENEVLYVRQQLQRVDGVLVLKPLKSSSSLRALPLSEIGLGALRDEQSRQLVLGWTHELGLVFLNSAGRPHDQKNVNNHLRKLCKQAGVSEVGFHAFRHTTASLMVASGTDLHKVKEQLGHSQISLTANLYAHGVHEAQRKAVNELDGVLKRGKIGH
jgi:integrase